MGSLFLNNGSIFHYLKDDGQHPHDSKDNVEHFFYAVRDDGEYLS
jgi:hypothetical protein